MTKREREVTDIYEILKIIDKCRIIHLGLYDRDEDEVYLLPMNFGYTYEDGKFSFYMHGATHGRKYEIIEKNHKATFEMECDVAPIVGKVACQYGTSYECVMGKGTIELLDTPEEKMKAMTIFMRSQTGKEFEFNEKLVSVVNVMKMTVTDYTAKRRPIPEGQERMLQSFVK